MTLRPSIGKKANRKLKYESPSQSSDADERNACLKRLADNNDRKAQLQADRFAMSLFAMDPTSSDAVEFLTIKKKKMLIDARLRLEMKKKKLAELHVDVPDTVIEVDDENQDLWFFGDWNINFIVIAFTLTTRDRVCSNDAQSNRYEAAHEFHCPEFWTEQASLPH